jgi:hypothetical protein
VEGSAEMGSIVPMFVGRANHGKGHPGRVLVEVDALKASSRQRHTQRYRETGTI